MPVRILGLGAVIGGEFLRSVEISNLEFVFLPRMYGLIINLVTILGVTLGLVALSNTYNRFRLSTLFFLTPLVYGSPKVFSKFLGALRVLDYG